jgi:intracellular multiplication protein IcmL
MDTHDALTLVFERNRFYRRQYLLALFAFAISLCAIVVLILMLGYLIRNPRNPIYFATDNVSRLIYIVPVDEPNMPTSEVYAWSIDAVQRILSYDFMNYRSQLQGSQKYFTELGWNTYKEAFTASNNLPSVLENRMIVLARVIAQPEVVKQGLLGGAYAWQLKMPVLIIYWKPPYDDNSKFSNALVQNIIVQRQPILQSYKGLGIAQLYFTTPSSASNQPAEIS